jgi:hypothetical protein
MIFRSRKLIMPSHLNAAGTLFGGQALSWVDEESYIFATCQLSLGDQVHELDRLSCSSTPGRPGGSGR